MTPLLLAAALVTRPIDTAHSTAAFSVAHVYVERVTGTVPILSGSVTFDGPTLVPSSVTATLDAAKLRTGDDDRDAALQGDQWFDTKRFPAWTFTSTAITPTGASSFTVAGDLTIHGVTKPQTFDVTIGGTAEHPVYRAAGRIDRRMFGMRTTPLDPVIGNPVDVTLDVTLK